MEELRGIKKTPDAARKKKNEKISEEKGIQIILCTHSRHLLAALGDSGKIIWMKDGKIKDENADVNKFEILMDIGALDKFDEI